MTAKKAKAKTTVAELQGMPGRDAAGRSAVKYLAKKAAVLNAREDLAKVAEELADELKKSNRKSISVEGSVLSLKHVEADQILCKKAQSA